jgi:hypothetical protein
VNGSQPSEPGRPRRRFPPLDSSLLRRVERGPSGIRTTDPACGQFNIIAPDMTVASHCLAALTTLALMAGTPPATLEWPFGRRSELPSPDGRHIVYGVPYRSGLREGPELWLRDRGGSGRKLLLQLGSTARALWFPDSRNFLLVDRESSSSMNSYIYDAEGRIILDIRAALLRQDPELDRVANGHFYVDAQRLLGAHSVRVAAFGHTDEPPVRCFRFIYKVNRSGKIERLSKRISPATAAVCDEESE